MLVEVKAGNCGAEITGVECRAVRRFGQGACPETPRSFERWRVPKHPTGFGAGLKLTGAADTPSLILQLQTVTSRAAVLTGRFSLSLRNQEFSEWRTLGACFAEDIGVHLTYLQRAPG